MTVECRIALKIDRLQFYLPFSLGILENKYLYAPPRRGAPELPGIRSRESRIHSRHSTYVVLANLSRNLSDSKPAYISPQMRIRRGYKYGPYLYAAEELCSSTVDDKPPIFEAIRSAATFRSKQIFYGVTTHLNGL